MALKALRTSLLSFFLYRLSSTGIESLVAEFILWYPDHGGSGGLDEAGGLCQIRLHEADGGGVAAAVGRVGGEGEARGCG